MSVIIRLQNLPWNASALDIRRFFHGLSIPDGGVHIIGGEKGDAFIAFSTDEDARQGMMLTGERVNDVPVKLFLSSKTEMQNVIASARTGPVNVVRPKEDDFQGPDYPEGRGAGFSDMAGPRNPGSVLSSPPQSMMFGGNNSLNRDAGFSQSGGLNDQRGMNQGGFNPNLMGSKRPEMNSMGVSSQTGLNKPFGNDLFESNLRDEGNQLGGFNRSGGRLANDVKQINSSRMHDSSGQSNQIRGLFDAPLNAGSRNGNRRPMDKSMGEMLDMPNNRASQLGGARMSGGFGGNDNMLGLDRNLDLSFNWPDDASRDVPHNFDPVHRYSSGDNELGINDRFNKNMDVGINRPRFNDFGTSNESGFNRPSDRNFSGVGERSNLMEPSGGNISRLGERDVNNDRRDPFGFGRDQVDRSDRDEFGRNKGMGGVDSMMGSRRGTGIASDFGRAERFGDQDDLRNLHDDIGSNRQFRNGRPFEKQESGRPFGGQEPGRLFDERDQGRDFGVRDPGKPFGGQVPIPSLMMGQNSKNSLWSSEPMDDFNGGRSGRLERGKIQNLMPPRDQMDRPLIGGYHSPHLDLCIHIFNLPLRYNYREIRVMFRGYEIPKDGLKLVNDQFGERSGESFIRFENEGAFSFALTLNNHMVEGKKLRVERCTMREYNDAVDSYRPLLGAQIKTNPGRSRSPINRKTMDPCILIMKMPLKTTVAEIKKFLGNNLLIKSAGGPFLELNKDNRPTGNAVVEFARESDFKEALMLNRRPLGGSLVSVIGIEKKEFNEKSQAARREAETKNNTGKDSEKEKKDSLSKADSGIKPSHDETCVQLAGLSWDTTNESIFEFFKGMKIVKDGIYIVRDRYGKPTGAGYVEFGSAADRRRAFLKHKHYMGKRYVEVISISSKQMIAKIKAAKVRQGGGNAEVIVLSEDEGNGESKIEHTVRMQNLHSDCQLEDIMDFFRGLHPIVDSIKLQYKDGKPTGDGLVSFQTSRESTKAISDFNRRSMLGRAVTLSAWPKK